MQEIIGIQYKQASKVYYFDPKGEKYNIGDEVIVDTQNGPAYGVVAQENSEIDEKTLELPLKPVIRKVTDKDIKQLEHLKQKAEKSFPIVIEKIEELSLPMKVVEVEYSFDETKITISFTAEGRVDFRELLKLLASSLRVKIELRQIGAREEVKAVGALGLCGNECCCCRFLKEPEHVVVKMAKLQNLSLSPTKTGGACGKIMCCLAYEDPVYREILSKMPKVGSTIKTPDGEGVVTYNDILKEKVTVKFVYNDDSYKYKDFLLKDLNISNANAIEEDSVDDESDELPQEDKEPIKNENNNDGGLNKVAKENQKSYNNNGQNKKFKKSFNKNKFNKKGKEQK